MTILKTCAAAAVAVAVTAPAIWAYSGENYVVCNLNPNGDNFLALRACGATKCELLMKLGPNTGLLAIEPYSGSRWREVTVLSGAYMLPVGPDGWVYDKYICEVAE